MDAINVDSISKRFAQRRLSRRAALTQGGAGLAAAALATTSLAATSAQDATPAPVTDTATDAQKTEFLFVQTFQSGTIAPVAGAADRYTLTLEAGSGQTVYFSDRPERIVGATATPDFLEGLGFLPDNPPNAALVVETAPGETDIAVVELFAPLYDPISQGVTYEVEVLANWQDSLEMGFHEAPTDLAALAPAFGSAQLFIDDCPNLTITCQWTSVPSDDQKVIGEFADQEMCWNYSLCIPCEPYGHTQPDRCSVVHYWQDKCAATFPNQCSPFDGCGVGWNWPAAYMLCWE